MAKGGRRHLELEVDVGEVDGLRTVQLIPRVDGTILGLDLESHPVLSSFGRGRDPDLLLTRPSALLPIDIALLETRSPGRTSVWQTTDPVARSWISLVVRRENAGWGSAHDCVLWTDWEIRSTEAIGAPGVFRFSTEQYYGEVIRVGADRWWADVPRRTSRYVACALDARPEILGRWGAALLQARGYVRHGAGKVELEVIGARSRSLLQFSCDPAGDADLQAARILAQLEANPPDALPAVFRTDVP